MHGWHGRILFINLSTKSSYIQTISQERLQAYIGGRSLAVSLFRDYSQLDPFDPDVPLIFTTGPLSGTCTPASERLCILSRSPLTGTIFDTSSGGSFAHAFKASGYDGLFITGESTRPLALRISSTGVDFVSADSLWGKPTTETIATFTERGVAAIGPAGENGVLYANIVFSDGDNDGRGGLGAVMGNKMLKAIAVDGDMETTIAEPSRLQQANQDIMRLFRASPAVFGQFGLHHYGTPTFVDVSNQRSMLPTHNFQATFFKHATNLSGPTIRKKLSPEHDRCHDCPIACKLTNTSNGRFPEYSALCHFGPLLGNGDLQTIINANNSCRELGLDPISAASTLATRSEITGAFPNPDKLSDILFNACDQHADDPLLALGSRRLADAHGKPETSMTVKSLELPAFDPRGATGMALSYCTSTLGGSHIRANLQSCEILRKPIAIDRFSYSGKARLIKIAEDSHAVYDSLIVCHNAFYAASLEEYSESLSAITGIDYSPAALSRIGEETVLQERTVNKSNGFSSTDDILPERFFNASGTEVDGLSIPPLNKKVFKEELQRYDLIRGFINQIQNIRATTEHQT